MILVCREEKLGGIVENLEHTLGNLLCAHERIECIPCAWENTNRKGEKVEDALANLCCGEDGKAGSRGVGEKWKHLLVTLC